MDFNKRVYEVCRSIPRGKVATYGQIALLCGKPKNARQAGHALGHMPKGVEAPAYRVVNARGHLSGAAAFAVPKQQRRLLEAEGVIVDSEENVDLRLFGWHNTMEDALRLLEIFESRGI